MARDAARYLPAMSQAQWRGSLYEVKTVLMRNEADDGRPILLSRNAGHSGLMCVLGGKLDNIYELFDALKGFGGAFSQAHSDYVTAEVAL